MDFHKSNTPAKPQTRTQEVIHGPPKAPGSSQSLLPNQKYDPHFLAPFLPSHHISFRQEGVRKYRNFLLFPVWLFRCSYTNIQYKVVVKGSICPCLLAPTRSWNQGSLLCAVPLLWPVIQAPGALLHLFGGPIEEDGPKFSSWMPWHVILL